MQAYQFWRWNIYHSHLESTSWIPALRCGPFNIQCWWFRNYMVLDAYNPVPTLNTTVCRLTVCTRVRGITSDACIMSQRCRGLDSRYCHSNGRVSHRQRRGRALLALHASHRHRDVGIETQQSRANFRLSIVSHRLIRKTDMNLLMGMVSSTKYWIEIFSTVTLNSVIVAGSFCYYRYQHGSQQRQPRYLQTFLTLFPLTPYSNHEPHLTLYDEQNHMFLGDSGVRHWLISGKPWLLAFLTQRSRNQRSCYWHSRQVPLADPPLLSPYKNIDVF